jgi:hypothetical protein
MLEMLKDVITETKKWRYELESIDIDVRLDEIPSTSGWKEYKDTGYRTMTLKYFDKEI